MSFACIICGQERDDNDLSHDSICIYCDNALMDDFHQDEGQLL